MSKRFRLSSIGLMTKVVSNFSFFTRTLTSSGTSNREPFSLLNNSLKAYCVTSSREQVPSIIRELRSSIVNNKFNNDEKNEFVNSCIQTATYLQMYTLGERPAVEILGIALQISPDSQALKSKLLALQADSIGDEIIQQRVDELLSKTNFNKKG